MSEILEDMFELKKIQQAHTSSFVEVLVVSLFFDKFSSRMWTLDLATPWYFLADIFKTRHFSKFLFRAFKRAEKTLSNEYRVGGGSL